MCFKLIKCLNRIERCVWIFKVIRFECFIVRFIINSNLNYFNILFANQPAFETEAPKRNILIFGGYLKKYIKMIGGIAWSETFPTKTTLFIFLGYMSLFVCQGLWWNFTLHSVDLNSLIDPLNSGIFVTASQDKKSNKYKYNTVVVVLITELVKLIVSVLLYWKR